ncbi:MAG: MFS transporter [Thermodesulfobacteriota bacterium]|nr:MFS transporter [Thermodesulfobacteriota bacterium]
MDKSSLQKNITTIEVDNGAALRTHLAPVIFLTVMFFLNFLARIVLSPLTPAIEQDMGLGHGEMGSFFLFVTIGYFVSLTGSGFVSSRISHRRVIAVSSIAVGLVLLSVCCAETVWGISACMFVLGLAAGLYLPSGIATITNLINPLQWGKALAIHEIAPNLGFVAAPLLSEVIMVWFSWRGVMVAIGLASILTGFFFLLFGRGGEHTGEKPNLDSIKLLLIKPSFWVIFVLFSLGISSSIGAYSMLPLYLVAEHGILRVHANTIVAVSRISTLFIVFFGGWAADRFGPTRTLNVVFLLSGIMTILLGIVNASWLKLIVVFQPLFAVCFFPVGFALLSMISPPRSRGLAVSLAVPVGFMIGAGFVPMGIGILGDAGHFNLAFIILGIFILSGSILLKFVRLRDHNGKIL